MVNKFNKIFFLGCAIIIILFLFFLYKIRPKSLTYYLDYDFMVQFDPDREGGHLKPNLNMLLQAEKRFHYVRIITNSKGFRNTVEFPYMPPGKTFRVLFLGDSFVDGMRTDQKETIGYILEQLLNKGVWQTKNNACERFEVMISGHNNPAAAWYYYQTHGIKYHPHLVILGVTLGNDIISNNFKSGFMPFTGENGMVSLKFDPQSMHIENQLYSLFLPQEAYEPVNFMRERIQDLNLIMLRFLARQSFFIGYSIPPALGFKNGRRSVHAAEPFTSLGLFYRPILPEIEHKFDDFETELSGFSKQITAHNSSLLVVLFPVRIQVSEKDWGLLTKYYSLRKEKFDLNYPNQRIAQFCKSRAINCLDLVQPFRVFVQQSKQYLFRSRGDMHFNEKGQALTAEFIYEKIAPLINTRNNK